MTASGCSPGACWRRTGRRSSSSSAACRGALHVAFEVGTQSQWLHDLVAPLADRVVAFIIQPRVIDRILTHLRRTATERRRGAGRLHAPPPLRTRCATASTPLGSGAVGVCTCRLVAQAVPDPGRAIGSRPLIGPRMRPKAAGGPPHQVPWTAHSPSSTLGGPIGNS